MEDKKFSLEEIEKTFTQYKRDDIYDAFIVSKRDDGAIVNIGGKNDAFISKNEFIDYENLKIGEKFKAKVVNMKNDEGFIEVSKNKAEETITEIEKLKSIKIGSKFTIFIIFTSPNGISSKLGDYDVFVPASHLNTRNTKDFLNKQIEVVAVEIDKENKKIIASKKIIEDEDYRVAEENFWRSIFENKVVFGTVEKIVPFGAFVNVDGINCLVHISEISYEKIESAEEVLKIGKTYQFRVVKLDRENKKVGLSYKALQDSPSKRAIKKIRVGAEYNGEVIKLLPFGAIIKLDNGVKGMLHISHATQDARQNIYEIVKLGDFVKVKVLDIDEDRERISFSI